MSVDHVCAHDMGLIMECGFCQGAAQERARAVAIIEPLLEWACLSNDPRLYPIIAAARDYCAGEEKP